MAGAQREASGRVGDEGGRWGGGLGGSLELGVAVTLGRFLACPQESSPYRKSLR